MDTKTILNDASGRMQKAIDHLEEELLNVRAGKASPNALNGVMVDYFGSQVPISGAASVTVPDAKTILIQPWDKNMLRPIEKAIIDSNIGLTPSNNGEQIRLTIPPLTEERRKELVKQVRAEAETARISLRNARRDAVEAFKKAQKEGMPEDESKDGIAPAKPTATGADGSPPIANPSAHIRRPFTVIHRHPPPIHRPSAAHPPPICRTVPVPQHKKSRSPTAETGIHLFAAAQAAGNYFTFGPAVTSFLPSSLPVNFTKFFTKRLARSSALTSQSLALL